MLDAIPDLLGGLLLAIGLLLATVGLYGMFRRPAIFEQLHAAGLLTGPAVILVLLASLATGRAEMITSALLVVAFVLVTASLSTHVIADTAWRRRGLVAAAGNDDPSRSNPAAADRPGRAVGGQRRAPDGPRRILVAYDGSPSAEAACDLAGALRWTTGAVIRLVSVHEADLPALTARGADPTARAADADALDGRLRAAAERVGRPGLEVEWRALSGEPADAIVEHARAVSADLVVTGSRGLGYRSLVLGSVANEVIDRAPCPVLVARSSTVRSALVTTDGSEASDAAVDVVARWPLFEGMPIRVLSIATGEPGYTGRPGTDPMAGAREASQQQRIADAATGRLIDAGRAALPAVRVGDAAAQILAEAASVDLIVIGSRGRTGLARALLGSVARTVLLSASTSVLVVRHTGEPEPHEA